LKPPTPTTRQRKTDAVKSFNLIKQTELIKNKIKIKCQFEIQSCRIKILKIYVPLRTWKELIYPTLYFKEN